MKKIFALPFIFLFLAAIISPASAVLARVVESGLFEADLPQGWQFSEKDDIAVFVSPDKKCVFIITSGLSEGVHKKKASGIVTEYSNIVVANPEQHVTVTRVHGLRIVVTILGDHPDRVPLYYSIRAKVPGA